MTTFSLTQHKVLLRLNSGCRIINCRTCLDQARQFNQISRYLSNNLPKNYDEITVRAANSEESKALAQQKLAIFGIKDSYRGTASSFQIYLDNILICYLKTPFQIQKSSTLNSVLNSLNLFLDFSYQALIDFKKKQFKSETQQYGVRAHSRADKINRIMATIPLKKIKKRQVYLSTGGKLPEQEKQALRRRRLRIGKSSEFQISCKQKEQLKKTLGEQIYQQKFTNLSKSSKQSLLKFACKSNSRSNQKTRLCVSSQSKKRNLQKSQRIAKLINNYIAPTRCKKELEVRPKSRQEPVQEQQQQPKQPKLQKRELRQMIKEAEMMRRKQQMEKAQTEKAQAEMENELKLQSQLKNILAQRRKEVNVYSRLKTITRPNFDSKNSSSANSFQHSQLKKEKVRRSQLKKQTLFLNEDRRRYVEALEQQLDKEPSMEAPPQAQLPCIPDQDEMFLVPLSSAVINRVNPVTRFIKKFVSREKSNSSQNSIIIDDVENPHFLRPNCFQQYFKEEVVPPQQEPQSACPEPESQLELKKQLPDLQIRELEFQVKQGSIYKQLMTKLLQNQTGRQNQQMQICFIYPKITAECQQKPRMNSQFKSLRALRSLKSKQFSKAPIPVPFQVLADNDEDQPTSPKSPLQQEQSILRDSCPAALVHKFINIPFQVFQDRKPYIRNIEQFQFQRLQNCYTTNFILGIKAVFKLSPQYVQRALDNLGFVDDFVYRFWLFKQAWKLFTVTAQSWYEAFFTVLSSATTESIIQAFTGGHCLSISIADKPERVWKLLQQSDCTSQKIILFAKSKTILELFQTSKFSQSQVYEVVRHGTLNGVRTVTLSSFKEVYQVQYSQLVSQFQTAVVIHSNQQHYIAELRLSKQQQPHLNVFKFALKVYEDTDLDFRLIYSGKGNKQSLVTTVYKEVQKQTYEFQFKAKSIHFARRLQQGKYLLFMSGFKIQWENDQLILVQNGLISLQLTTKRIKLTQGKWVEYKESGYEGKADTFLPVKLTPDRNDQSLLQKKVNSDWLMEQSVELRSPLTSYRQQTRVKSTGKKRQKQGRRESSTPGREV